MIHGHKPNGETRLSLGYIAGLFDGEGNINIGGINRKGAGVDHIHWHRHIGLTNNNYEIICRLQRQLGGRIFKVGRKPTGPESRWKQSWRWVISGSTSDLFLKLIYPWLIIKRPVADVYLRFAETVVPVGHRLNPTTTLLRYSLYRELIALNTKGLGPALVGKIKLPVALRGKVA
jgi:hypothetical protein